MIPQSQTHVTKDGRTGMMPIRWMIRMDMPEVLDIEGASFEFAWTADDFVSCLRQRNCIGMVAEEHERIVGFMVYELRKESLHLLNFAVHPKHRRCHVGKLMIDKLKDKLSQQRRRSISLNVRESNLQAQLFFRSQGLLATDVVRGFYEDVNEDAYVMEYEMSRCEDYADPLRPLGR